MTTRFGNANGDRFNALYAKYYRRIIRFYVVGFRLSEEDAEELAQDTFLRFFEAMDEYRGEAEWAFLETTARNVAFNRLRSLNTAKRSARTINIDDPGFSRLEPAAPLEPDYADRQHDALRRKRVNDAIAQLPPGQRQCIQLWLEDFSYVEIGKALRISLDAVRSRLRDAKRLLRERLGDENVLPEDDE
jgi:RNA polymerase sigma factor (sigma-70 family)